MQRRFFFMWLTMALALSLHGQITVSTDRNKANYAVGEPVVFNISSTLTGTANYEIRYSQLSKVLEKGEVSLVAGQSTRVVFTPKTPCFLLCKVSLYGNQGIAGASVSQGDLQPLEPEPADFDAFWNGMKAQLAQIPPDPHLTFLTQTGASTTYRINLANIDGRRVYGYISIPTGQGPFPAVLQLPAYGSFPGNAAPIPYVAENLGVIAMSISIHNTEPDVQDPNAYQPNDFSTKEGNYYKYALMAAVRSIDYIFSRSDFDGSQLALFGVSQGGGLSLCTAGLDQRVKLLIDLVPALCRHDGMKYGRPSGHPHYIWQVRTNSNGPEYENNAVEATKYYDAVNFAKRYHGPSLTVIGYIDETCPPATCYTANNQLLESKIIMHHTHQGHGAYFVTPFDWYRYVRGYFTGLNQGVGGQGITPWYVMNASGPSSASAGVPVALNAQLQLGGQNYMSVPVKWEKIKGPGKVKFTASGSYQTQAVFSTPGTYLLKVTAIDDKPSQSVWYEIIDYVWVNVN